MEKNQDLMTAAKNSAALIVSIYKWLDRVEKAGGATSIEGIAVCNSMMVSLRKNADLAEKLVMEPLRRAIEEAKEPR